MAYSIFKLLRPRHWIKNFAIFPAIIFSGELFNDSHGLFKVLFGFFIFCILSSAIYVINDLFDIEKDRLHPFKKFRPLAHGDIPVPVGIALAVVLSFVALVSGLLITPAFFLILIIYILLQFSYSATLKHIEILDILALASGYILRVYAGEFATGYHISVWLLLTIISLSLFLAVGKRRSELSLISKFPASQIAATRKTLSHYSEQLLDIYATIFATSTFISYALFTFNENPNGFKPSLPLFLPDYLPSFLNRKWLMITILPVVYGLMRYLLLMYKKHEGESPERMLFSDQSLLITVTIWVILVISLIYFIGPQY